MLTNQCLTAIFPVMPIYPADTRNINGSIDLWLSESSDCRADTRKRRLRKHLCLAAFVPAARYRVPRLFLPGLAATWVQTFSGKQRNPRDFTAENAEHAETKTEKKNSGVVGTGSDGSMANPSDSPQRTQRGGVSAATQTWVW